MNKLGGYFYFFSISSLQIRKCRGSKEKICIISHLYDTSSGSCFPTSFTWS